MTGGSRDRQRLSSSDDFNRAQEEDLARGIAMRQVDYFIKIVETRYGVEEDEIPELLAELRWLRQHRDMIKKVMSGTMITVVGALLMAMFYAVWEGLKIIIKDNR